MSAPDRLEVGRIVRAHGLRGEVVVALTTDRLERVDPGAQLWADDQPVEVVVARRHQDRWLVTFVGVTDRDAADALSGRLLRAAPVEDPDALWVHDLIGSKVVEVDGTPRGRVVEVQANPAHDLLVLDDDRLVPVVFVVDCSDGITTIDPPDGLFD